MLRRLLQRLSRGEPQQGRSAHSVKQRRLSMRGQRAHHRFAMTHASSNWSVVCSPKIVPGDMNRSAFTTAAAHGPTGAHDWDMIAPKLPPRLSWCLPDYHQLFGDFFMPEKAIPKKRPARQQMLQSLAETEKSSSEHGEANTTPEQQVAEKMLRRQSRRRTNYQITAWSDPSAN